MCASFDADNLMTSAPLLCCCALENADAHREYCDLDKVITNLFPDLAEVDDPQPSRQAHAEATAIQTTSETWAKRRQHRLTMARLRERFRKSIDALKAEEKQLKQSLLTAITKFEPRPPTDSRLKVQLAYYELVKEQLAMEDERKTLDQSFARRATYARLVQRGRDESQMAIFDETGEAISKSASN